MCGIAGFVDPSNCAAQWQEPLRQMTSAIAHRGPDDQGHWFDKECGVALGHRRLSVLDLSSDGHQPMASESHRYHLVFNGEIYNFGELREQLEALCHAFRGHSDTEVMLAAFEQWGVEDSVKRFVGMFAFAVWDRKDRVLHLVRDRLGEKPLYYGWAGNVLLFGSELKALRSHPMWCDEIDRNALATFMRHSYIPAPYSIYRHIQKLLPGTILNLPIAAIRERCLPQPAVYWSIRKVAEIGAAEPFTGTDREATDRLECLLRQSIRNQMVADVPLGAFLSGGIDSSTVVALMQAESHAAVKTFTIGFNEEDYDEAKHAKAAATFLGTDHTELYLAPKDAMSVIPKLPSIYDEPFSDFSQIPTLLVSQLARQHVTVSLSGDAGDELFCGYKRYRLGKDLWSTINRIPILPRRGIKKAIRRIPAGVWDGLFGWTAPLINRYGRPGVVSDKLQKVADLLDVESADALYRRLVSNWKETDALVPDSVDLSTSFTRVGDMTNIPDFTQRMMFADAVSYLPDDILVKLDRASMAVSLESRVPFLDHRVVEFAWQVPMSMKLRDGQGKWLLRQLLRRYLPDELIDRPKMGFGVPIGAWLRGPLRDWAESLLDQKGLLEDGFLDPKPIRDRWEDHLLGSRNWQYHLWDVLMFQSWRAEQQSTAAAGMESASPSAA